MQFVSNLQEMWKNRIEAMSELNNYKSKLKSIEGLIEKLETGDLSINELSELEQLTRELHERSIILKYKAFEAKSKPEVVEPVQEVEAPVEEVKETPVVEEPKEEKEEATPIDFSLFDNQDDEVEEEEEVVEEKVAEEPIISVIDEKIAEETPVEKPTEIIQSVPSGGNSFLDRVNIPADALGSQFTGKLDSLIGAFGLNERLRYINDLFDGSSDAFGDAIKSLDSQSDLNAVRPKIDQLASDNHWDPDEEVVASFVTMIKRRYA